MADVLTTAVNNSSVKSNGEEVNLMSFMMSDAPSKPACSPARFDSAIAMSLPSDSDRSAGFSK